MRVSFDRPNICLSPHLSLRIRMIHKAMCHSALAACLMICSIAEEGSQRIQCTRCALAMTSPSRRKLVMICKSWTATRIFLLSLHTMRQSGMRWITSRPVSTIGRKRDGGKVSGGLGSETLNHIGNLKDCKRSPWFRLTQDTYKFATLWKTLHMFSLDCFELGRYIALNALNVHTML